MKIKFAMLCLALPTFCLAEQTVQLELRGIDDRALNTNVRIYLAQISDDDADGSERYQFRVREAVDKGLRALGYYNTQYHFQLTPRPRPQLDLLTLQVVLDKRVKVDERDVQILGEGKDDIDFERIIETLPPVGTYLNHEDYENVKGQIERTAQMKGYFDGEWALNRLEIFPSEHWADWRLHYKTGERYRYGNIRFTNNQIREDYLANILRVKPGEPYHLNDLSRLSSDFSSSSWFSSVLVEPELKEEEKVVDLNVLLQPRKRNEIEVGIGYVTDVGPRFQLGWKKPWINRRGHSFESNTYISKPEQRFEFAYNMPVKKHPVHFYYQISGGLEREKLNDTKFTGARLGFQRFWNNETDWAFSLGLKARYDAFQQGNQPQAKTLLVYPTASLNRKRSDGNRFALWGDSQKLTVNWGSKMWGSDVNFYSFKASSAWIRTLADNHRFYFRGEMGYLNASEFKRIPPSLRYFAGGDMSVRGFGYKKISPFDENGKLTGGSHLLTGTAEYQYQVYPNWWAATFYDTGLAAKSFKSDGLHSGVGLGVRWASPIGAIKFDLATPIRSPNAKKGIHFYIGLGSEL